METDIDPEEDEPVTPTYYDMGRGRDTQTEYTFDRVYTRDVEPDEINVAGVTVEKKNGDTLLWQYREKEPVLVTQDAVFAVSANKQARRQAYYAVSVLEDHGYVSGWTRT